MSALYDKYIIDGVPQELTPAQLIESVCPGFSHSDEDSQTVVDETVDPALKPDDWSESGVGELLSVVKSSGKQQFQLPYSDFQTRTAIAVALVDKIWNAGHFCLENLALRPSWRWSHSAVGTNAAFYESVQAAVDYMDSLGLQAESCSYRVSDEIGLDVGVVISKMGGDEFADDSGRMEMLETRSCPSELLYQPDSWIIYVPFDTAEYRLGGSVLSGKYGCGGVSPQIQDADYFIDCYEVVRELVEDGIALSGVTVGKGGLMAALDSLSGGVGIRADLSELARSAGDADKIRLLFSEVPGVLLQVSDADFDYIDAEFLLQDVAFYPLGHPDNSVNGIDVILPQRSGLQAILGSLLSGNGRTA